RFAHQRTADGQHLLLAAGHGAAPLAEALLQSREQRQHMLQLALVFLLAGEEGAHGQVLLHRQPGEDAPPLGYHGDALAHDVASVLTDQLLALDRKSTRLNSSHVKISYAVFCLKKKKKKQKRRPMRS